MTDSFFRSRWVERPAHVRELEPTGLPAGFRAAGVAAGLKPAGLDVGVLVSDEPATVSAARFTTNARVGAPVIVSRQAGTHRLRAVVANAGGSNTGDGERGIQTAHLTQERAAELLNIDPAQVGVASTGVIGVELPRQPLPQRELRDQPWALGGYLRVPAQRQVTLDPLLHHPRPHLRHVSPEGRDCTGQ